MTSDEPGGAFAACPFTASRNPSGVVRYVNVIGADAKVTSLGVWVTVNCSVSSAIVSRPVARR